jgi:hypothetical protein
MQESRYLQKNESCHLRSRYLRCKKAVSRSFTCDQAVMQESREKAAKLVCNEKAMKARIEELERLLLVAIESSCSKDNMVGSLQALTHIRYQGGK